MNHAKIVGTQEALMIESIILHKSQLPCWHAAQNWIMKHDRMPETEDVQDASRKHLTITGTAKWFWGYGNPSNLAEYCSLNAPLKRLVKAPLSPQYLHDGKYVALHVPGSHIRSRDNTYVVYDFVDAERTSSQNRCGGIERNRIEHVALKRLWILKIFAPRARKTLGYHIFTPIFVPNSLFWQNPIRFDQQSVLANFLGLHRVTMPLNKR
jgi:hypothetical protein